MSGFGAPRLTATPMPDDMMSARLSASSRPFLIRSSVWKSTSTARSNGSPASIRRFITAATSAATTGVTPVDFSNPGPSSPTITLVTREPKIFSSAALARATAPSRTTSATIARNARMPSPGDRELDAEQYRQHHHGGLRLGAFPGDQLAHHVGDEAEPDAGRDRIGQRHRH